MGPPGGFADGCGLFGVSGHRQAARLTATGLRVLRHRGSVGVAVASSDGHGLRWAEARDHTGEAVVDPDLHALEGSLSCGAVWGRRWEGELGAEAETAVSEMVRGRTRAGEVVATVSGHFTNGLRLRRELEQSGAVFRTSSDAELLLHLVAHSGQRTFVNRLVDALWKVRGAYAILVMAEDRLVAVRDPSGFRPLVLGRVEEAMVVASEDAAIRFAGGQLHREVRPGEMVVLEGRTEQALRPFPEAAIRVCSHELVSLARVDANTFGCATFTARTALGARLAREQRCADAEVVVALPGAEAQAQGFAQLSGLPVAEGLLAETNGATHVQWRPVAAAIAGRSVCVVAATVVQGRVARGALAALVAGGASEVHLRVASPWIRLGCPYGVASPTTDELLHRRLDADPATLLGASSVGFLSLDGMSDVLAGMPGAPRGFCQGCFSGDLPIPPEEPDDQLPLFHDGGEGTDPVQ
ncbi:MAG: hypothetical protein KTR31_38785 [Myxococcales bacterium]|nr:hypothetical protein [Myxococcales bacterium]